MKESFRKHLISYTAVAVSCLMIGSGATMAVQSTKAQAEMPAVTTVVTSPFTAAVAEVHDSVVGVVNYQTVRYSNSYSNPFANPFNFGFGFGYDYGYGNGRGGDANPYTEQEVKYSSGSGVVVADGGYVLTNYHVVDGATRLEITTEDQTYPATLIAYDENLDVAVLLATQLDRKPVVLGDSDSLQVGDWAICIGNPLSDTFTGTVTTGIVSALNRSISSTSYDKYGRRETITNTMIQTDAAINNGNSGGGMFSVSGELMGIPTLKYSGSAYTSADVDGIGMCIPVNSAKPIIDEALADTEAAQAAAAAQAAEAPAGESTTANQGLTGKPRMGITITSVNTSNALVKNGDVPNGVYVSSVEENGPAAHAGMMDGDIIVDVDDTVITSVSQLQGIIAEHHEGDVLKVKVFRLPGLADYDGTGSLGDGEYVDLTVTLAVVDAVAQ